MHTLDVAAVRDHRVVRRRGGDDGGAGRHARWSRRASPRRSTSAARCARSTTSTARTGGSRSGARTSSPTRASASSDDWMLQAERRSGTASATCADGFNLLDPIKCTIITPGLDMSGKFAKTGIPASIVTKFLAEHGVVVEKTGLYSFFIMFTIGITKGRWNTLLTALQQFKDDYDRNQPLWRILPEFCAGAPALRAHGPARPVRRASTRSTQGSDVARLTTEMYLSDLQPAMKPSDAFAQHRAPRDRARRDRRARRPHHDLAADAVSAGHSAADSGRALQPQDRRLPAVRARLQRSVPRLRHRRPRPRRRRRCERRATALLRRLRARRSWDAAYAASVGGRPLRSGARARPARAATSRLAAADAREAAVVELLRHRFGHASAERAAVGPRAREPARGAGAT